MKLTHKYRVKNPKKLQELARAINQVWNFCCETQRLCQKRRKPWLSSYKLCSLTAGSSTLLGLHANSIQQTCAQFVESRNKIKRCPRFRSSSGSKRALGWVPFKSFRDFKLSDSSVIFMKVSYPLWMHRPVEGKILCGSFNEDAQGHWWMNVVCEVETATTPKGTEEIGVDLGLKDTATLSTGEKLENPRHYRREELKLAMAQRHGHKKRARAIHAKIRNRRKYDLHVASKMLVDRCSSLFIGNVNSSALAQTSMAKSVNDIGWSMFRTMLQYKAIRQGVKFAIVNEAFSTQTCSVCKTRSGPKGLEGLGVREWDCSECGSHHDRDVNAARNILLTGSSADLQQTESQLERVG